MSADNFALFFNIAIAGIGLLTVLLSMGPAERDGLPVGEYYALMLFSVAGMMLMGGGGLIGGFASGWIMHALGVRRTMLVCFSGCFVMAFLLFKGNHSFSGIAYPKTAVLAVFFGISQGALSAYIPELFPQSTRAAATGFCFNVGRPFTA
ncbi:hypothetical protein B4Q13_19395, partial [Lacticaseibacillus rhamnosus]